MAKAERNVVKPPNQELQGLASTRSAAPRPNAADSRGPNAAPYPGLAGGSADLTRQPSAVAPVNHRFDVDHAQMAQPAAAVDPGKGAIPVNPSPAARSAVAKAVWLPDDATEC